MLDCSFCGDNRNDSGLDISTSGISPLTVGIFLIGLLLQMILNA